MAMPTTQTAAIRRDELSNLLQEVARGDRKALRETYERTSAKLYGVCLRIARDREAADDILQDVYLKVWKRAGRFNPAFASPITWLCAIARNAAIDWVRKHGRPALPANEPHESSDPDYSGAMEAMSVGADRALIFDCLDALPDQHKRAIHLAFFDGLSHSELADTLRTPLGTTKSWIRRGLLQLRGCLQDD